MAAPKTQIVQINYHNPDATIPLMVPVAVLCNTPEDIIGAQVRTNSERDLDWCALEPAHRGIAIMCGGGASIIEHLEDIEHHQQQGATVFAMNACSKFLRGHGIIPDFQVIADGKQETAQLVDPYARRHLFASQVHPDTVGAVLRSVKLWHLECGDVEEHLPPERRALGGYVLIGGGAAVGNCALALAYAMGYREFHIYGYDSCHREGASHAYPQPMNDFIPTVDVEWAGRTYRASVAMKAQAEKFQITAQALKQAGCSLHVYGDGLLQAMYLTQPKDLTERDKYRLLWQFDGYRDWSPGEHLVTKFFEGVDVGTVIDFGCGTGRASIRLAEMGFRPILVDFADNCRDEEALSLPFMEWDLSVPMPLRAKHGICFDVMEHIPPEQIDAVIENIMQASERVAFSISTIDDKLGDMIGERLHLSVHPHDWWAERFRRLGYHVASEEDRGSASDFLIVRRASGAKT